MKKRLKIYCIVLIILTLFFSKAFAGVTYLGSGEAFDTTSDNITPAGIAFNNDGTKVFVMGTDKNEDEVNLIMDDAALRFPDLIKVVEDPIVSSDVIGMKESIIFDRVGTLKIGENMIKTLAWYDNGYNHASRILDVISLYKDLK